MHVFTLVLTELSSGLHSTEGHHTLESMRGTSCLQVICTLAELDFEGMLISRVPSPSVWTRHQGSEPICSAVRPSLKSQNVLFEKTRGEIDVSKILKRCLTDLQSVARWSHIQGSRYTFRPVGTRVDRTSSLWLLCNPVGDVDTKKQVGCHSSTGLENFLLLSCSLAPVQ